MSQDEYIKYCKERAYKQFYYDMSCKKYSNTKMACVNACISMLSDLSKNEETKNLSESFAFLILTIEDELSMREFIDGFN